MPSAPLLALALVLATGAPPPSPPVLVELFTSEDCEGCPAQEDALARLVRSPPKDGAQVVPLAFHMDAYDTLGWKDRFGSEEATRRQRRYNSVFHHGKLFAPHMVVDGTRSFLADAEQARRHVADALASPKAPLHLAQRVEKGTLHVEVRLDAPPGPDVELWVAVTEDGLVSKVTAGPNKGRTLTHTATVRLWQLLAPPIPSGTGFTSEVRLKLGAGWKRERLRVVVALQKPWGGRVEGLASVALGASP